MVKIDFTPRSRTSGRKVNQATLKKPNFTPQSRTSGCKVNPYRFFGITKILQLLQAAHSSVAGRRGGSRGGGRGRGGERGLTTSGRPHQASYQASYLGNPKINKYYNGALKSASNFATIFAETHLYINKLGGLSQSGSQTDRVWDGYGQH